MIALPEETGPLDPVRLMESVALSVPEGVSVEYVEGEIYVTPPAKPEHSDDIDELEDQLRAMKAGRVGAHKEFASGLVGEDVRAYVKPDLYVLARESNDMDRAWARVHDNYFPLGMLALVVEVVSPSTKALDYGAKYRTYAACEVPVYMLVDRLKRELHVFHEPLPEAKRYAAMATVPFGTPATLPKPFGKIDTSTLF
jgi:Uma2 family endonuclease